MEEAGTGVAVDMEEAAVVTEVAGADTAVVEGSVATEEAVEAAGAAAAAPAFRSAGKRPSASSHWSR